MFIFSNSHDMFNDTYVYMTVRTQFASADFENDRHMNDFGMRVERRMVHREIGTSKDAYIDVLHSCS